MDDVDAAFPGLVCEHQDGVYSLALRLTGNRADAEDVAQDTFVAAYRALTGWDEARRAELRPRAWLATIAVNLVRNRARAASRRPQTTPLAAHDRSVEPPEVTDLVDRLRRLPERYRVPVALRHLMDLSYDEMAEVLGRPEGTLKSQVARGLDLLRKEPA